MHSLGIVQWKSTRRDHPGNPGGVSGSSPVRGDLTKVAKVWFYFLASVMVPTKHVCTVRE